jgi:hypothetical protein
LTPSRHRILFTIVFALLLLGMQREAQVHALQHLGGILHPAQQQGIQAPVTNVVCLECSLLAGGASAVAVEFPALPPAAVATQRLVSAAVSRTLSAPSYYSSRAPPPLL